MGWMEAISAAIQYVEEHIRNRRLALAGNDLAAGEERIIDIA